MVKLKAKGQKWLKGFHLFFACLWVGGAVSVNLMLYCLKGNDGMQLYGINQSINFIDIWVIIPGNAGIILTGLLYSIYTNWGWFKHRWVTVKWVIALYGMVFGIIWLGPWAGSLEHISKVRGLGALKDERYTANLLMLYLWGTFQAATIIFAVFISAIKPWKKKSQ
jgi:hypothetical protein